MRVEKLIKRKGDKLYVKWKGCENHTYCFFDDIINIKNFGLNKIKIDEMSYKNILIYYVGYVTIKVSKYVKINNGNLKLIV